ncbi:hypothetical protein D3C78_1840950 [compost metagenome]
MTKVARPRRMMSQSRFSAQAAAIDAMAFSTWKVMVPLRVSGIAASGKRTSSAPCAATMASPSRYTERRPCARWVASTGWLRSSAK